MPKLIISATRTVITAVLVFVTIMPVGQAGTKPNETDTAVSQTDEFQDADPDDDITTGRRWKINKTSLEPTETSAPTEPIIMYYTNDDVIAVSKVLYLECRGVTSTTEQACVAWTVCNRVDDGYWGNSFMEIITYPNAFAYSEDTPVWPELYSLAEDVLSRWNAEQNGQTNVGRVLPPDYMYFHGDGEHNYFRNAYDGNYQVWDYSWKSPYEN